jgi:peptide/nickel transport system permease protein
MSAVLQTASWRRRLDRFRHSNLSLVGLVLVAALVAVAVLGPGIVPYPDDAQGAVHTAGRFAPPSAQHWFGTNELGQDMFTLVIAGARVSLFASLAVVGVAALIGTVIGAVSGYFGGWVDEALMRFTDLILTLPSLILAMAVAAALGAGLTNMIIAISLSWWPGFARLVRGEVLAKRQEPFIQAAQSVGAGTGRILWLHLLPNILTPIVVKMALDVGFALLTVASLGFIGIGVRPPTPEWGLQLAIARPNMPDFWWTAIFPGCAIVLTVFAFNLVGDGLRDMLDQKTRR